MSRLGWVTCGWEHFPFVLFFLSQTSSINLNCLQLTEICSVLAWLRDGQCRGNACLDSEFLVPRGCGDLIWGGGGLSTEWGHN